MKLFLDTADIEQIKTINEYGIIDGVTTNPTLIAREGVDFHQRIKEISRVIKGPVNAEVTSLDTAGMIKEAHRLAVIATNVVIKLPMTGEGIKAVHHLSKEDIQTNVTLVFSANQAILAAKAGASYVSPFVGRLQDTGYNGFQVIADIASIFSAYEISTNIIAASIRNSYDVTRVALHGGDIVTAPFKVINQMFNHPLTDAGLDKFMEDWQNFKN